jgi:bifunctional non-homologous end joining protein LigD
MMKKIHWINSKFVAEIKFAEWTRDGKLRAPVFMGLREDKRPGEVIREAPPI